jgi:hypothetical protein
VKREVSFKGPIGTERRHLNTELYGVRVVLHNSLFSFAVRNSIDW